MDTFPPFQCSPNEAFALAKEFGTPLYVISESDFRKRLQIFRSAIQPTSSCYFASKANPAPALMRIAVNEGFAIDVASEGEFRAAVFAGIDPQVCNFHGNFKLRSELQFAIENHIGEITVDNIEEVEEIAELCQSHPCPDLLIRICPAVDPQTHIKVRTGQHDSKFGLLAEDGSAERCIRRCLELNLPLIGLHAHVGSQLIDPSAQAESARVLARLAIKFSQNLGWRPVKLNLGGGIGIAYTQASQEPDLRAYLHAVESAATEEFERAGLDAPQFAHEPGRAVVAHAGVTIYTVGPLKVLNESAAFVAVDGGLSDNPRPALYDSVYTVLHHPLRVDQSRGPIRATVVGRHCETDNLFFDQEFAQRPKSGDLIQVLSTGAYNSSMASNYNQFPRPAMVLLRQNGQRNLITARETQEQLRLRDLVPPDLDQ